jgi:hypothetical protein
MAVRCRREDFMNGDFITRKATWSGIAVLLIAAGACGCRAPVRPEANGTTVAADATIHGRVKPCGVGQCFTFEGVESSLLSFTLVSDDGSMSAPLPYLSDPEGKSVNLSAYVRSPEGAATMQVSGIPLRKTGIYRLAMANAVPGYQVFWRFQHHLEFPPIEDMRVRLAPDGAVPVYIAAPRGGQVTVRISPIRGSNLDPDVQGVLDPWGGRALDPTQLPAGTPVPMVGHMQDGSMVLQFHAPRPGIYTVYATSKPCRGGDASISAQVSSPAPCAANVWHNDAPCPQYGTPGDVATTGTAPAGPIAMR